jgi:hypothetical protein
MEALNNVLQQSANNAVNIAVHSSELNTLVNAQSVTNHQARAHNWG